MFYYVLLDTSCSNVLIKMIILVLKYIVDGRIQLLFTVLK